MPEQPLVARRVSGDRRLDDVVRAGVDREIVLAVGFEADRRAAVDLEREVRRALRAAVVVHDDLLDDERRRLVVVRDRAGLRLAEGDRARAVRRSARLRVAGLGRLGDVVGTDRREGLRHARGRRAGEGAAAGDRDAVDRHREVTCDRVAAVVVDDVLDHRQRRCDVVVRDRAGRRAAVRDDEVRAVVVGRAVAGDRRLDDVVGAGVDREVVLAVGLEPDRRATVHLEREVLRGLRAAVVVHDDLLDDQRRRLVVVRDRAGGGAAERDHELRAVRVARRVPADRRLYDVVRAGVDGEVVLAVGLERDRRAAVHPEREVGCDLGATVVVHDDLLDDERRRAVVVGDRAGRSSAERDHELRAVRVARRVPADRRFDHRVGPGVDREVVLPVCLEDDRRAAVHLEREVVRGGGAAVVVDDDLLDDQRCRLVVVRDGARRRSGERDHDVRALLSSSSCTRRRPARRRCRCPRRPTDRSDRRPRTRSPSRRSPGTRSRPRPSCHRRRSRRPS